MIENLGSYSDMEVELMYRAFRSLIDSGEGYILQEHKPGESPMAPANHDELSCRSEHSPEATVLYQAVKRIIHECQQRGMQLGGFEDFTSWENFCVYTQDIFRDHLNLATEDF